MSRRAAAAALAWAAVLGIAALVLAPSASAHATVTSSTPLDGADLATNPTSVTVTFDEAVGLDPGYLQVINADGVRVDRGDARHADGDNATVVVALRVDLPDSGGYLASFRVVSADGHPVGGTVAFTVGGGAPVPASTGGGRSAPNGSSGTLGAFIDVGTVVTYVGLALAGGAWLVISRRAGALDARRVRVVIWTGLLLGIVGAAITLLLHGAYVAGPSTSASTGRLLADTARSSFGVAHLVQIVALSALLLLTVVIGRRHGRLSNRSIGLVTIAGVTWIVALGAQAASGHSRVRSPVWLNYPSTVLHLLAVTTWVGGVAVLLVLIVPRADPAAVVVVRRLSSVALAAVAVIVVTGVVQAWLETGSWAALFSTTYGALIMTKVGLLLTLVGLGALARRRVRGRDPVRAVRPGVAVEAAVMVAVFAVTAVLVAQPPARTAYAAELAAQPATASLVFAADRTATLTATPAHRGPVSLDLVLRGVAEIDSVTMTASLPAGSIGPVPIALEWQGGPHFRADAFLLPSSGMWTFEVTLRISRFDAVVADTRLPIT